MTTPSASATTMSPGFTVTQSWSAPRTCTGTWWAVTFQRPIACAGVRYLARMSRSISRRYSTSRMPPSTTTPAQPRACIASASRSPKQQTPRMSPPAHTGTTPGGMASIAASLARSPLSDEVMDIPVMVKAGPTKPPSGLIGMIVSTSTEGSRPMLSNTSAITAEPASRSASVIVVPLSVVVASNETALRIMEYTRHYTTTLVPPLLHPANRHRG